MLKNGRGRLSVSLDIFQNKKLKRKKKKEMNRSEK